MDTDDQLTERDRAPAERQDERSRSAVRKGQRRARKEIAGIAVVGVTLIATVNALVAQPFVVPSESMRDTLHVGDRIVVNKLAYRFGGGVERGDIVVFDGTGSFVEEKKEPENDLVAALLSESAALVGLAQQRGTDFTKRVVGIGGDRVTCCDSQGRVTVNGAAVDESGALFPGDVPSNVPFDIAVPEGKLFVLGDHRSDSRDSREHLGSPGGGMVPMDRVIGRVDAVAWPPSRWRTLERPGVYARIPGSTHG